MKFCFDFINNTFVYPKSILKSKLNYIFTFVMLLLAIGHVSLNGLKNTDISSLILYILLAYFLSGRIPDTVLPEKQKVKLLFVFSAVFTVIIMVGVNYNFRHRDLWGGLLRTAAAVPGVFLIVRFLFIKVCYYANILRIKLLADTSLKTNVKAVRIVSFFLVFIPCIIVWANMYPGTYSGDAPSQINQAVNLTGFENMNPFINTLIIIPCIQIGMYVRDIGTGIAIYLFLIAILYSLVWSYVCGLLYKAGFRRGIIIATILFADYPINLIYVVSMYKDTFYAICFLLSLAYVYSLTKAQCVRKKDLIIVVLLSLVTSLARNSGWSALLILALFLFICARKNGRSFLYKISIALCCGAFSAFMVMGFIYPIFNISTIQSYVSISVQLQQIARVAKENNYTDIEKCEIIKFGKEADMMHSLSKDYDERLVDPIRSDFDLYYISEHKKDFNKMWFTLGTKHLKEFAYAYIDHTCCLWWPDAVSWITDSRIFENDYGIERKPLLFPQYDIAGNLYYDVLARLPIIPYLNNSGITFWLVLVCLYLCLMRDNILGAAFCAAMLTVYVGLLIFAYSPLFRYTYSVVLSMPLLLLFMELQTD